MTDLEANRLKINEINDTAVTFSLDGGYGTTRRYGSRCGPAFSVFAWETNTFPTSTENSKKKDEK